MVTPLYGAPASAQKSALAAETIATSAAAANAVFNPALGIFIPPVFYAQFDCDLQPQLCARCGVASSN
jgi:hypothetical protein